jgi:hypothetical protein
MPEEIKLSGGTPFCPPGGTDTTGVGILDAEPVAKPAEVTEAEAAGEPELLPPIAGVCADADGGEGDNVGMGIAPFARLLLLPTPLLLAGPAAAPLN